MKISTVVKSAAAGMVIYVAMAACAASEQARTASMADEDASASSGGTSGTSGGGSIVDVIADVWAEASDPVKDAKADPLPPEVSVETCNKTYTVGADTHVYAEHSYPGESITTLTSEVSVVVGVSSVNIPAGYSHFQHPGAYVKEGAVAVTCGPQAGPAFSTVTFVRRR